MGEPYDCRVDPRLYKDSGSRQQSSQGSSSASPRLPFLLLNLSTAPVSGPDWSVLRPCCKRCMILQTSSEKHGKRSSCILLLGSRTSFFHGFNGVVRTLRRRPPAQVERQRKQVYNITLVGPKSVGFLRCYTHMTQKDYLPKSNGKEKQPSGRTSPQKSKITAAKPST